MRLCIDWEAVHQDWLASGLSKNRYFLSGCLPRFRLATTVVRRKTGFLSETDPPIPAPAAPTPRSRSSHPAYRTPVGKTSLLFCEVPVVGLHRVIFQPRSAIGFPLRKRVGRTRRPPFDTPHPRKTSTLWTPFSAERDTSRESPSPPPY